MFIQIKTILERINGSNHGNGLRLFTFHIIIISALSALSIAVSGIFKGHWLLYGHSSLYRPIPELSGIDPIHTITAKNITFIRQFLEAISKPIYESPLAYVILGYGFRIIILAMVYSLARAFKASPTTALASTAVAAFTINPDHLVTMNIAGTLSYKGTLYAIILILTAFLFVERSRPFLAGLVMGVGAYIHIIYIGSAIGLISIHLFLQAIVFRKINRLSLAVFLMGFAIVTVPLILKLGGSFGGTEEQLLTFAQWFSYIAIRDPDDVFASYELTTSHSHGIIVLLSWWFAARPSGRLTSLERWIASCGAYYLSLIFIEILHANGIEFGFFSDLVTTMELRRFTWLILLFSIMASVSVAFDSEPESLWRRGLRWLTALIVVGAVTHWEGILLPLGLVGAYIMSATNGRRVAYLLLGHIFLIGLVLTLPDSLRAPLPEFRERYTEALAPLLISAGMAVVAILPWHRIRAVRPQIALGAGILTLVVYDPIATLIANSVTANGATRLERDIQDLGGWHQDVDIVAMLTLLHGRNPGSNLWGNFANVEERDDLIAAYRFLGKTTMRRGMIMTDPMLNLDPRVFTNAPVFLFENDDRTFATLTRRLATDYDRRLREAFGHGLNWFYQDQAYVKRIQKSYRNLDADNLRRLAKTEGIRYAVLRTHLTGQVPLYKNTHFQVYDLNDLSEY